MALPSGARLGAYEILAAIGAGGMGEVYKARDTRLGRTVAIKVLPAGAVGDPARRRRFEQEARAASALNHPNIVTLHGMASDGDVDYLVMEYVPGESLDTLITPRGLPLAEALDYAHEIAKALSAAHAAGIVHRDIKPANVIVTAESHVKVLDFGLAKLVERAPVSGGEAQTEPALTEAWAVMGTVAYMSPEQASGKALDHRTDIFSLGIILYDWMIPTMGGAPRRFLEQANTAIWSPDGTGIAYFEPRPGDPVSVADRQGINPRQIYASRPGEHTHYESYSPDGRYIYFARGFRSTEMDVWRVPAAGGQAERLTHHNSKVSYPVALDDRTLSTSPQPIMGRGRGSTRWT